MNLYFKADYERSFKHKYRFFPCLIRTFRNHELRILFWFRQYQLCTSGIVKSFALWRLRYYRKLYGIELPYNQSVTGKGLRMIHPWNITVNANAVLGDNVTLFKGVTIGVIEKGEKAGNPTIGNNVTIYANATICGNVRIGDNCEISAGSFVNFDVPDILS